uniref:Uncharacterized protein n=1 Tax=Oryza nivara TaxID=4536 RepID=A0A0E0ITM9_ORYNI
MAAASSSGDADDDADAGDRLKGSATSGVTGLSASDGKSSTLGDSASCCWCCAAFLGDDDAPAAAAAAIASGAIILKFLWTPLRRSYSLNACFLGRHGAPLWWCWWWLLLAGGLCDGGVVSEPVSIWTTCLKEAVSAWTKVVGNGVETRGERRSGNRRSVGIRRRREEGRRVVELKCLMRLG